MSLSDMHAWDTDPATMPRKLDLPKHPAPLPKIVVSTVRTHETRNSKLLDSFHEYCEMNPEQRFWQALRNWSGEQKILVERHYTSQGMPSGYTKDTFHWEGKNE
jgi:hypothetical protein